MQGRRWSPTAVRRPSGFAGAVVALAATAAVSSVSAVPAAASSHRGSSGSCLSAARLSAAVGTTWSGLTVTPGLSPGQKLCTYTSRSTGATFLISHEALDGSTVKELAHDTYSGTHFVNVTVKGDKGLKGGHPGFDILLVQKGSQVYEFLDNSGTANAAQLEGVAKLVVP
jgi:hypothetical protein